MWLRFDQPSLATQALLNLDAVSTVEIRPLQQGGFEVAATAHGRAIGLTEGALEYAQGFVERLAKAIEAGRSTGARILVMPKE